MGCQKEVINLDPKPIIINMLKAEARIRPDDEIYLGPINFTFKEFVGMLNNRKLPRKERKLVKMYLKTLVNMFNTSETFQKQCLSFSGV